jgi:hypothetical protein
MGGKMEQVESSERRQSARYAVDDALFVTFRPHFDRVGKLRDISKDGAAIEYSVFEPCQRPQTDHVEIDFFSRSEDFHLPKIPCKVVYDVRSDNHPSFNVFETRRCGLQFGGLTDQQSRLMDILFTRFTLCPPTD